ncbi:MAG: hypothetical protein ACKOQ2_22970, partial [Dolichospermum sp.]
IKRIMVQLGEYYQDMLALDAFITGRTSSSQASSLLGAKLQEREPKIKERLLYLATKKGISVDDLTTQILNGNITNDELED